MMQLHKIHLRMLKCRLSILEFYCTQTFYFTPDSFNKYKTKYEENILV